MRQRDRARSTDKGTRGAVVARTERNTSAAAEFENAWRMWVHFRYATAVPRSLRKPGWYRAGCAGVPAVSPYGAQTRPGSCAFLAGRDWCLSAGCGGHLDSRGHDHVGDLLPACRGSWRFRHGPGRAHGSDACRDCGVWMARARALDPRGRRNGRERCARDLPRMGRHSSLVVRSRLLLVAACATPALTLLLRASRGCRCSIGAAAIASRNHARLAQSAN
jgi:hypothetical protein